MQMDWMGQADTQELESHEAPLFSHPNIWTLDLQVFRATHGSLHTGGHDEHATKWQVHEL